MHLHAGVHIVGGQPLRVLRPQVQRRQRAPLGHAHIHLRQAAHLSWCCIMQQGQGNASFCCQCEILQLLEGICSLIDRRP